MAKDRNGSVNIYGPMQAKTADGIVAFTDGIARENADGSYTLLEDILENTGGIIDVEKLPMKGWKGTPLPNDDTIIKEFYFNNELSIEETVNILNEVPKNDLIRPIMGEFGDLKELQLCIFALEPDKMYSAFYSEYYNTWIIANYSAFGALSDPTGTYENPHLLFCSNPITDFGVMLKGWDKTIQMPIIANNKVQTNPIYYIAQSKLISSTPFIKEEPNDKCIYRLNETVGWKGTPVDINTRRVYFNTALSGDEVNKIIDEFLSKTGENDYVVYDCDGEAALNLYKNTLTDGMNGYDYFVYNQWVIDNNYIDLEYEISIVGEHNDLLSSLISSTPFEKVISSTYHVYKDGKWTQLSDTYNPQIFTEVDELPKQGWEGTPVPNSGYVEKVYFNTNLNADEVNSIISSLTPNSIEENLIFYHVLFGIDDSSSVYIEKSLPQIAINGGDDEVFYNGQWTNTAYEPYVLNQEVISNGFVIDQNDKLSSLISTTPFVKSELPQEAQKTIYKVKNTEVITEIKDGTTVPNSGHVDKVYYNDTLNYEEVNKILDELTYVITPFVNIPIYPILFSMTGSPVLFASKVYNSYEICLATDITNQVFEYIYTYNWQAETDGFIKTDSLINNTVISSYSGLSIGNENEKLSKLVSVTPFKEVNTLPTGTYSYYTYNGKEFVRLDNNAFEGGSSIKVIDLGEVELDHTSSGKEGKTHFTNIVLTKAIYDTLLDKVSSTLVKVKMKQNIDGFGITQSVYLHPVNVGELSVSIDEQLFQKGETRIYGASIDAYSTSLDYSNSSDGQMTFFALYPQYDENTQTYFATLSSIAIESINPTGLRLECESNQLELIYENQIISAIQLDTIPSVDSQNLITSGGVYHALQDTLKKTDIKYGENDAGFTIGDVIGSGDKNLFYDLENKKWKYCDASTEDEILDPNNEIATINDVEEISNTIDSIKDVSILPVNLKKGEELPTNDTIISKLYFNTEASKDEVVSFLESNLEQYMDNNQIIITYVDDLSKLYIIFKLGGIWIIANASFILSIANIGNTGIPQVLFSSKKSSLFGIDFEGWNPNITFPIEYNLPLFKNDKPRLEVLRLLPYLVSVSPSFTTTENISFNTKNLYRLTDKKYNGTPVPTSGVIEKIYVNTNLLKDEVTNLLIDLPYVTLREGVKTYLVFADTFDLTLQTGNFVIVNYEEDSNDFILLVSMFGQLNVVFDSNQGWYNGTQILINGVEYNTTSILELASSQLGLTLENSKLSDLFSITPFEDNVKSDLYTYDGEWCKLVKERALKVIDVSEITETDENGYKYLDLSENGVYMLTSLDEGYTNIEFGYMKASNAGKFLKLSNVLKDAISSGRGVSSYIILDSFSGDIYIKVEDNEVTILASYEE